MRYSNNLYMQYLQTGQTELIRNNETLTRIRPVGRNFQRGVRRLASGVAHLALRGAITARVWGSLKAPSNPGAFGSKSCNLAISRHFIYTFGKSCQIKIRTLIVTV